MSLSQSQQRIDSDREVDEMVHQLPGLSTTSPTVSHTNTRSSLRESERTDLPTTTAHSHKEVIQ